MKKIKVLNTLIQEQNTVISNLEKAIEIYKNASDLDEDDTIDPEDFSHQTEAKEMQMRLEQKLKKERFVVANLEEFKNKKVDIIQNGALVQTNKMFIYVGVVAHPVEFEGQKVVSVSQKAPIMRLLQNKKVGDTIKIGDLEHFVKSID